MIPGRRTGIAVNLYLAFAAVASLAVIAGVVGWFSYARLSQTIETVADAHVPSLILAGRLSEQGGAIIAAAPTLALASSPEAHARARAGLDQRLAATSAALAEFEAASAVAEDLRGLLALIAGNLESLDRNVGERLSLNQLNRELMEELRWLHADFMDEAEPLVDDARFGIETAIDNLAILEAADTPVERLRDESRKAEAVLLANADANLAIGLIGRVATIGSAETLAFTTSFLDETTGLLRVQVETLAEWSDTVTLRQIAGRLFEIASPETGIPALRAREIAAEAAGSVLLEENQRLVALLDTAINDRVGAIQETATLAAREAHAAIGVGRQTLLVVAALSLLVSLLIGWRYVHKNLTTRIVALAASADAIAGGDLKAKIPEGGRDEISDMARALRTFRDAAVQNERSNFQAIIDNAHAGLLMTDPRGRIEFFNPLATALLSPEPGADRTRLADRFAAGQRRAVADFFSAARPEAGDSLAMEAGGRRPDGSPVAVELHFHPYRHRDRAGYIVTVTDMTERREAERILEEAVAARTADLRRTNKRLVQEIRRHRVTERDLRETQDELVQAAKLAALGQLAAGIGHELNQPLAAIRFFSRNGALLLGQERLEEAQENFSRISALTARMALITKHLKRFARRPGGDLYPVRVEAVVSGALSLFGPRFSEEKIAIRTRFPPEPILAMGEEIRLEQVFVNLLSNALDAVGGRNERAIDIVAHNGGESVVIDVTDSGGGVPEPDRALIFDPFHTTKEVGAGLGLGLSISYNIIKDFGGRLELLKTGAEGTTFRVTLPSGEPAHG